MAAKKTDAKVKSIKYAPEGSLQASAPDNSKYDADDLLRAAEIMGDKERFKRAHKHIKQKKKAIKSIADLHKAYADKVSGMDMEMEDDED